MAQTAKSQHVETPFGLALLENPTRNKGTAFTEEERWRFGLEGFFLPASVGQPRPPSRARAGASGGQTDRPRATRKTPTVIRLGALALFLRAFVFGRIGKRRYIFSLFAIRFVMAACALALSHFHAWAGPATHFDITPTFMLAGSQATFTITALDSSNNIDPAPRTVIVEYPQDLPGTFQPTSVDLTFGTGAFLGTLKVGNHLIILVDKDNPNFTTFILLTGSSSTPKRLAR